MERCSCGSYYEKIIATGEVKCIDEEIPFEIPTSWSWTRLSDVSIYIQRGKSPKYSPIKKYPVIAQKCNQWTGFSIEKAQFIEPETLSKYAVERLLQDEDLMWNSTGLGTLGRMAVYYKKLNPYELAVADSHVTVIRLLKPFMFPLFFYYYFASPTVQSVIEDKSDGSTKQKELSTSTVCNYLVPIPPTAEQEQITSKVTTLLPIVEKYGMQQEKLDILNKTINDLIKKSVLQEAIQGKLVPQIVEEGTAQELLEKIQEEKQRLVNEGKLKKSALATSTIFRGDDNKYYEQIVKCIDDEIPFEIPNNWLWTRLSYVSSIYTGNSISEAEKRAKFTEVKGRYYIGTKDVGFDNKIVYNNGISIPLQYEQDFRIAPANSILMCIEGGSAGKKIAVLNQDVCFGNKLCCFSPFVEIGKFMYYYLQSPSFIELFNLNKTGIIGGVSIAKVKEIVIPLPPLVEQQRIVAQIEKLFEQLR